MKLGKNYIFEEIDGFFIFILLTNRLGIHFAIFESN